MPGIRRQMDRHPVRRIPASRHRRRLGRSLYHHGLRVRGDHGCRAGQVPDERRPVQRRQAGDVVGGGKDRPGRGRGRIPRPQIDHHLRQVPDRHPRRRPAGGSPRRQHRHLDHHALDHPRQPGGGLRRGHRLRGPEGGNRGREGRSRTGRGDRHRRGADPRGGRKRRNRNLRGRRPLQGRRHRRNRVPPSAGRQARLLRRLRGPRPARRFRRGRHRHRLCPHRAGPRPGRLGTRHETRRSGARDRARRRHLP